MSEIKREVYICQGCEKPLLKDTDGFVVKGNIMVANGEGGLIGNAFPKINPDGETIRVANVKEYPLCTKCFYDATFGSFEQQGQCFMNGTNFDDIPKTKSCHVPSTKEVVQIPNDALDSWEEKRKAFGQIDH